MNLNCKFSLRSIYGYNFSATFLKLLFCSALVHLYFQFQGLWEWERVYVYVCVCIMGVRESTRVTNISLLNFLYLVECHSKKENMK